VLRFAERDNRGRVTLYFSPQDQTVQLRTVRGIGWQGVPDRMPAITGYKTAPPSPAAIMGAAGMGLGAGMALQAQRQPIVRELAALDALKACGFAQRIFTADQRNGKAVAVGDAAWVNQHYTLTQTGDQQPDTFKRPAAEGNLQRCLNAEALNPPCVPQMGAALLPVDAIDASIAMTSERGAANARQVLQEFPDARPQARHGQSIAPHEQGELIQQAQARFDRAAQQTGGKDYVAQNSCQVIAVHPGKKPGMVMLRRTETPNEQRVRLTQAGSLNNENSYHSSIPGHARHHALVTAYDLALGQPIPCELHFNGWLDYLRAAADWRTDWKKLAASSSGTGFSESDVEAAKHILKWKAAEPVAEMKAVIDATVHYRKTGLLPVLPLAVKLISYQTQDMREANQPPEPMALKPADVPQVV
jgi:hypothetical protein